MHLQIYSVFPDDVLPHPVRADAPMHMASPNAMNFLILFLLAILSFIQLSIAAMYLSLYLSLYLILYTPPYHKSAFSSLSLLYSGSQSYAA